MSQVFSTLDPQPTDTLRVLEAKILAATDAGGGSGGFTLAQILAYVEANATAFAQNLTISGNLNSTRWQILKSDGSASFAFGGLTIDGSGNLAVGGGINVGSGNLNITTLGEMQMAGDLEIVNTAGGLILKSPNGNRYRLKVDNAGNLGTEPA